MSKISERNKELLSAEDIRSHIEYDKDTGVFVWKPRRWRSAKGVAGSLHPHGYIVITIDNVQYPAHRLAWLHYYGEWPKEELDHKDTNRSNNRIENLREATPLQNRANTAPIGESGIKGVRKRRNKWEASIIHEGVYTYLGTFDIAEEAAMSYNSKASELHGEFARVA